MALQLILGNSGAGKSTNLFNNIIKESIANPSQQYILIVPEQFTLETQKLIVTQHPNKGTMNIDIVSFERLAYRVFEEVGGNELPTIDDTGKNLIIRKVSQEKLSELNVLGANLKKIGYISEIKSIISEFTQYEIDSETIDKMLMESEKKATLNCKIKDIKVIYDAFRAFIEDKYTTAEETLDILSDVIDESDIVKDSIIAIDGFTGFTPIQNKLIYKLMKLAKEIRVTVTIDTKEDYLGKFNDYQLFSMSKKMIRSLKEMAIESKTDILEDIIIADDVVKRFEKNPELAHLEQNLFRYPVKCYGESNGNQMVGTPVENIEIFTSKTPVSEIKAVAMMINDLVKNQGMRYRDVAIISGNIENYSQYIARVFEQVNIPVFMDNKRSILMNPFVEYIRSALQVIEGQFSYESVFRYLRCGLIDINKEDIDCLENYCLALGIRGKNKWNEKWIRKYDGLAEESLEKINDLRDKILEEIMPLYEAFKVKNATVLDYTTALYEFIEKAGMFEKIEQYSEQFETSGELVLAKEYSQIYRIVMDLLEKVSQLLGDEVITVKEYIEILDAGFEDAKVGVIPPNIDCVMAGDIERSRLNNIKVLFLVGANEGVIPKSSGKGGIISQIDREFLKDKEIVLAPTARENAYIQKFYLYLNLTKPIDKLFISYAITDFDGKSVSPSYLINQILKLFPALKRVNVDERILNLDYINSDEFAFEYMKWCIRQFKLGEKTDGLKELYDYFMENDNYKGKALSAIEMAFYHNSVSNISKAVAKALYGSILENSVTRLEKYAQCAYAHFLSYGLGLQERKEYTFKPMDMGNIFHNALERFSHNLKNEELSWRIITDEKRDELADRSVEECVVDYSNTILQSSARNEYIIERIKRIMRRTVWVIQSQVKKGRIEPEKYEVSFSMSGNLESINFDLSDDEKMRLKGRIDRVDSYEDEKNVYVKVVDYKSGGTKFDLIQLYYGLQLQLVVYMNAAVELAQKEHQDKQIVPAGLLYYNIKDPIVDKPDSVDEKDENEKIKAEIIDKLKMNGLVNSDIGVIRLMDEEFEKKSSVIPVGLTKDGNLTKNSSVATQQQMNTLGKFVNEKVKSIGKEILAGNVEINPYNDGANTACQYCDYKSICGFDTRIHGFNYRRLKQFKDEEIWKLLKDMDVESNEEDEEENVEEINEGSEN